MSLNEKERQWLAELFDAYYDKVYAFLYARTGDSALAEDLASQTFVKIAEHFRSYCKEKGALSTWVFTIALNEMRSYFRRQARKETEPLFEIVEIPGFDDVEKEFEEGETKKEVLFLLSRLDARQRSIVTLKYYGGLTNGEIAVLLNLSESNVGTIMNRALCKLRDHLSNQCDDIVVLAYKGKEESI